MKKILKALLAVVAVVVLAGCNKVSENYAEKIRVADAKGENLTYAEVKEDLGEPHINLVIEAFGLSGGTATWYKGYESKEEADAAFEAGKTVAYITVTVADGKAIDAKYGEKVPSKE
jgi:spermidine/putrescine-binding protein